MQQYLTASGRTLFKGMDFAELRRMQIDIETFCTPGYEFPNAERAEDHLMAIAVSDHTGWEEIILIAASDPDKSEKAALERLNAIIRERDPDVFEGHNFFKFDLPYLAARAKAPQGKTRVGPRRHLTNIATRRACRSRRKRSTTPSSSAAAGTSSTRSCCSSFTTSARASWRASG